MKMDMISAYKEGLADMLGISKKAKDAKREKKKSEVGSGFVSAAHAFDAQTQHHPIPQKIADKWMKDLDEEFDEGRLSGWVDGYNFFSDKFNSWITTPEGEKWNDTQAKKFMKRSKR